MTGARGLAVVASLLTLGLAGCGGSGSQGAPPVTPPPGAANITISGTLLAGSTASAAVSGFSSRSSFAASSTFAGYKLYCVTFSSPPAAGTGVVNSAGGAPLRRRPLAVGRLLSRHRPRPAAVHLHQLDR
jgi:hypothetical protein